MIVCCQLLPNLLLSRTAGTAKIPLANESTKPLRDTSGFVISPASDGLVWYVITSSLQSSRQLKQRTHSLILNWELGSQAPSQALSHNLQFEHSLCFLPIRQIANLLMMANNAPSGQMNLQ